MEIDRRDYPSRKEGWGERRILATVGGKATAVETGLKHRTGRTRWSLTAYDTVGIWYFFQITDSSNELQLTHEVTTPLRGATGLPLRIRKTEINESLTHGIMRLLLEGDETDPQIQEPNIEEIALEWSPEGLLTSTNVYSLWRFQGEEEIFVPTYQTRFGHDSEGRIVRTARLKQVADGRFIEEVTTYQHEKLFGGSLNKAVELIYTRDDPNKPLELWLALVKIFDAETRECVSIGDYVNAKGIPTRPILGSTKPVYHIKPEFGGRLVLSDEQKSAPPESLPESIEVSVRIDQVSLNFD